MASSVTVRPVASAELVAIPFRLDAQRILVELTFLRPDGSDRKVLTWVNMGMPAPALSARLYEELRIGQGEPLRLKIGATAVEVADKFVDRVSDTGDDPEFAHYFAPHPVEAMLPASVLSRFDIGLDYQKRQLTFAPPGTLPPDGVAVPIRVNPDTGLVALDATVAGEREPVVIDAGSGYSWFRGSVVRDWLAAHPEWRRANGAVGQSNNAMVDYAFEKEGTLAMVPMTVGDLPLGEVGLLGTGPILGAVGDWLFGDLFWDGWGRNAPDGPVVGWLGANALMRHRLTIDYAHGMSYWRKQPGPDPEPMGQVGVTLVRRGGDAVIGGVVSKDGRPTVEGVQPGDRLLRIDGLSASGASRGQLLDALSGRAGERRTLVIERDGAVQEISATVTAF
ncbi:hypothetical protein [Azospirillum sp. sgz302134]